MSPGRGTSEPASSFCIHLDKLVKILYPSLEEPKCQGCSRLEKCYSLPWWNSEPVVRGCCTNQVDGDFKCHLFHGKAVEERGLDLIPSRIIQSFIRQNDPPTGQPHTSAPTPTPRACPGGLELSEGFLSAERSLEERRVDSFVSHGLSHITSWISDSSSPGWSEWRCRKARRVTLMNINTLGGV